MVKHRLGDVGETKLNGCLCSRSRQSIWCVLCITNLMLQRSRQRSCRWSPLAQCVSLQYSGKHFMRTQGSMFGGSILAWTSQSQVAAPCLMDLLLKCWFSGDQAQHKPHHRISSFYTLESQEVWATAGIAFSHILTMNTSAQSPNPWLPGTPKASAFQQRDSMLGDGILGVSRMTKHEWRPCPMRAHHWQL